MRLLSLDYDPVYGEATRASFPGDVSVFDYDMVIWDPEASLQRYTEYERSYRGLPSLSSDTSVRLVADVKRRRKEFVEFVGAGRVLVVMVRPPQKCYIDTGERSYSGTGRNRVTTTHVTDFDLLTALPISTVSFEKAAGSRIEAVGDGPISRLLSKYQSFSGYSAVMHDSPGSVIAKVTGTERVVASVAKMKGDGLLVMLPAFDFWREQEDDAKDDGWAPEAAEFQAELLAALRQLSGDSLTTRPAWSDGYATDAQQKIRDDVVTHQRKVEQARARLAVLQAQRDEVDARDQLFLGTGRALELQVRDVLELLGGAVTEPEPGRDDWKVTFPEGNAVVEVKGVAKSAAEKHAAQLEKWVAGAYEQSGAMPKGILVVNTWRETPLSERNKEDFPAQMLPYSEGRGLCLVTGLQLYLIRADVEAHPEQAEQWRAALLGTSGVMTKPHDWRSIIHEVQSTDES